MTHHKVVYDGEQVRKFAEVFCSEMTPDSAQILSFMSREKYCESKMRDNCAQLASVVINSGKADPDRFLCTLYRFECSVNAYYVHDVEGRQIPAEIGSTVAYLTINPKSMLAGWNETSKSVMDFYRCAAAGVFDTVKKASSFNVSKIPSVLRGNIHKSTSSKIFTDFDVDTKDIDKLALIRSAIRPIVDCLVAIIETRGGYHIIARNKDIGRHRKDLYEFSKTCVFDDVNRVGNKVIQSWFSIISDSQVPIPGTVQGGFNVQFVDIDVFMSE